MIYLIYPHEPPEGKPNAAPWVIGRELGRQLRRRGYQLVQVDYTERMVVYPDGPDDILIGHPHQPPGTVFRASVCAPWRRVIGMSPWNGSEEYTRDIDTVVPHVHRYMALCGPYWASRLPRHWPATALDLAIDPDSFQQLRRQPAAPGDRKFLYIGCTVPIKGTAMLERMRADGTLQPGQLGHIGYGEVRGATEHGYLDLSSEAGRSVLAQYDYLIMPGTHDANPMVVLEAMCWGLLPVTTDTCGYGDEIQRVRLDGALSVAAAQNMASEQLQQMLVENFRLVRQNYTWERFAASVIAAMEET